MAVAGDSRHVAAAGLREVYVWRTEDWQLQRRLDRDRTVLALAFSADSKSLVIVSAARLGGEPPVPCQLEWYDFLGDPTVKRKFVSNGVYAVAPDRFAAFAAGPQRNRIGIRNLETEETQTIDVPDAYFERIAFSPDGKWLVTLDSNTRVVSVWDSASGKLVRKIQAQDHARKLFFPADGKTLYTYAPSHLRSWDLATGKQLFVSGANVGQFLPDGRVGVHLDTRQIAKRIDLVFEPLKEPGKELARISLGAGKSAFVFETAVTPDQRFLLGVSGDRIRVWDIPKFKE